MPPPPMRPTPTTRFITCALVLAFAGSARAYEGAAPEPVPPAPGAPPQLTKPPALLTSVEAEYPPELFRQGITGEVVLVIDIAADGSVSRVDVAKTSGFAAFDESARAAILQYTFSPAEFDGQPGAVRLEFLYRFEPRAPPPEPERAAAPPPVNFRGRVLERGRRDPVAGAIVVVPGPDLVTETDAEGRFEFRGVPSGTIEFEIKESKHRTYKTSEDIREGEVTEITAYMWPKLEGGFEAVVKGERVKKEVARRVLEKTELTSVPGTFGDPLRVVQNLPGLSRPAFISGALIVRGAAPNDTSVLIDGTPIPLLYHFLAGPSVVNPSFIKQIDFFPGGYGAKYGRAIGGVIDVTTQPPEARRLHGNVKVDLLDAGFYLNGPIREGRNWGTFSLSARRSYIDAFLPLVLDATRKPGAASFATAPRYWDYQSRYDVQLGKNRLEFSVFGSNDFLSYTQAGTIEASGFSAGQEQGFHRLRTKWSRATDSGWNLSVSPTVGKTGVSFGFNDQVAGFIDSWDFNLRAAATKELGRRFTFEVGLDSVANLFDLKFKLPKSPEFQTFPGENPSQPLVERSYGVNTASHAAYVEGVWSPIDRLRVVPGLRATIFQLEDGPTLSLEPRLGSRFELSERFTLKGAWGLYRQGPDPMKLDPDVGNPYLGLSQSSQTAAGLETRLADRLTLDLQGFYNWRSKLEVASQALVVRDGVQTREKYANRGVGQTYGMELLLKQEVTRRFFGWVAYTLSRSEQKAAPGMGDFQVVGADQTHILTLIASYKLDGGWELGTRFRLTSGRPTTPLLGATYDADTGGFIRVNGAVGGERGPTFHQLDLRVEKTWIRETWRASLYLDVQNVYYASNPEFFLFNYRYSESSPFPGLPILPTLGFTGAF